MRKRIKLQQAIPDAIKELQRRTGRRWIETYNVLLWVYRRHQIDSTHPDYKGPGNLSYSSAELASLHKALSRLVRQGVIEKRIMTAKKVYPGRKATSGGFLRWSQVRLAD
jgi:hypothetical protein